LSNENFALTASINSSAIEIGRKVDQRLLADGDKAAPRAID
jgi:hypothetical protein